MFGLDFAPTKPADRIDPDAMYQSIHDFTGRLNPVDRAEKIERMVYAGSSAQELRGVPTHVGPAKLRVGNLPSQATESELENVVRFETPHAAIVEFGHEGDLRNPRATRRLELTDTAWRQICDRIKPAPYFRQNVEAFPEKLRYLAVNNFIQQRAMNANLGERMMLFRTWEPEFAHHPILRALVTSDYIKMDDDDVLRYLRETPEVREAVVSQYSVEEKHSTFKLVWPNRTVELKGRKAGDALCYSVDIRNSEVGAGSVAVYGAVEILSCTNGMTRQDQFCRFVHRGDRIAKLRLIGEAIREAARKTDTLVEDIRASLDLEMENVVEEIEKYGKALKWSDEFTKRVNTAYTPEFGGTLFDVTQAVTSAAKSYSGSDRFQRELEGGQVLSMGLLGRR